MKDFALTLQTIAILSLLTLVTLQYYATKPEKEVRTLPVESTVVQTRIVETEPRGRQIEWTKITADGHEYIVFQPAGNGHGVIHSVSCTNCAPKQNTLGNQIDWATTLNCITGIINYVETPL